MLQLRLMLRFWIGTLVFGFATSLMGQVAGAALEHNNISAQVYADGTLFHSRPDFGPGFQVPMSGNQDQHSIYSCFLWVGGKTPFGEVRSVGQTITGDQPDFQAGPISQDYDSMHAERYNRVWEIEADLLSYHWASWSDPGYVMPEAIRNWPAHGDTSRGEAKWLAPFVDLNGDGWYQPEQGEFPDIRGESAVFFMFNDDIRNQVTNGGPPMEIEVQGMVYGYGAKLDSALFESVFVHYRIINRSSIDYSEVFLGTIVDIDIGNWVDDLGGTDVDRNMVYGYNGDELDDPYLSLGWDNVYGNRIPAQGAMFLNRPLSSSIIFVGSSPRWPYTDLELYRNLQGVWWNGQPVLFGGDGHTGTRPTQHMFTGIPEDSSGWIDPVGASERDFILGTGPIDLDAGTAVCLDMAFPFAQFGDSGRFKSLIMLRERADRIQAFYDVQGFDCPAEPEPTVLPPTTAIIEIPEQSPFDIYPNPMEGQLWLRGIQLGQGPVQATLFDLQGRKIQSWTWPAAEEALLLKAEDLPAGTYLLNVRQGERRQSIRLYREP